MIVELSQARVRRSSAVTGQCAQVEAASSKGQVAPDFTGLLCQLEMGNFLHRA